MQFIELTNRYGNDHILVAMDKITTISSVETGGTRIGFISNHDFAVVNESYDEIRELIAKPSQFL